MLRNLALWAFCLLVSLLSVSAGQSGAGRAGGSMRLNCGPPAQLEIKLTGLPDNETATLIGISGDLPWQVKTNTDVPFYVCPTLVQCDNPPKKATLTFKRFRLASGASGTYTLPRADGTTQRGAFKVTNKQPKPLLCM